jgi:luciferase family oxidoreductase group 1
MVVALSVLDLVPVGSGSTASAALADSTALVRRAERLGFHRYWVAEHHGMPGIASSAPAVLIAHLAAASRTIRVGSGGVMLPNHQPLVVAEQFGTLEALHPGRIDLGIGRAPGTDQRTARALRRGGSAGVDDFPEQLTELASYFRGEGPVTAVPAAGNAPAIWLLGSSGYSAQVAGMLGLPFAFAHHFAGHNTMAALALYRERFRPSPVLDRPFVMIGVNVVCAETDAGAQRLALPGTLAFLRLRQGQPIQLPSPEEAAAYPFTDDEREFVHDHRTRNQVVGSPATVGARLRELAERTGADEMMITTQTHSGADRLRSYELVAEAMELAPLAA